MPEENDEDLKAAELEAVKLQAKAVGMKYHPNIGLETLQSNLKDFLAEKGADTDGDGKVSDKEVKMSIKALAKKEALAMVLVEISCMDPSKSEHTGEIFSCGNTVVGTISKHVPFNKPWHIEKILYNMIDQKNFVKYRTIKTPNGGISQEAIYVKAYSIRVLPALSKEELADLAQRQAMSSGTAEAA